MDPRTLIPLALLLIAGCTGAAEPATVTTSAEEPRPIQVHTQDPFAARDVTVGPHDCAADAPAEPYDVAVEASRWPGAHEHMAVFRMLVETDNGSIPGVAACVGWRFRMHTHDHDGEGTIAWHVQVNGTGLPLGLILPIIRNGTYHWELETADGRAMRQAEGDYPDAATRALFGFCDPHTAACVRPAPQDALRFVGRLTSLCALGTVTQVVQDDGPFKACQTEHRFDLDHAYHGRLTVSMDYVTDWADLDFELRAPDGRRVGLRDGIGDPTRLIGNRTEADLVVTDTGFLSQTGQWTLRVWAKAAADAEYGLHVTFEL